MRVSVIIPVLNEEARISEALRDVAELPGIFEVIVVDGGSTDRTRQLVEAQPFATLVRAPRGRATQLNVGAAQAQGEVLLFLHADVRLPADAARWVNQVLADPSAAAGAFRTWTVPEGRAPAWAPLVHLADLRSRYSRVPYGDQALFVRRERFFEAGGFPPIELMEDFELSRRLQKFGQIRTVPATVEVSARRFLARPLFYLAVMNLFPMLYQLGVPPRTLSAIYGHVR